MKWFTREWASGGLIDSEWEERNRRYASHLESVRADLLDGSDALVTDVNLHDAQVQSWSFEPDGSFLLTVLIGDLQVGYETVTLRYEAATTHPSANELSELHLGSKGTEIRYDEVDITPNGNYQHSILIHPAGELDISFKSIEVRRAPATAVDRR